MMYNFDEVSNLTSEFSLKWNSLSKEIVSMGIAEMGFAVPDFLKNALLDGISTGDLGYSFLPDKFYNSIINWLNSRHQIKISPDEIVPVTGIMSAVDTIIKNFSVLGDQIVIQPPVYNQFFKIISNSGRVAVNNNLIYENGIYTIDFIDFEEKLKNPRTKIFLLCNPQNPISKIWKADDLEKIAALCKKYNVLIISDEIHADLSFNSFYSFYNVAENYNLNAFILQSPCKTFNYPGLSVGYVISSDPKNLHHLKESLLLDNRLLASSISARALQISFDYGENWLNQVKKYIYNNYQILKSHLNENFPEILISPLEATYLVWIDCRKFGISSDSLAENLFRYYHLQVNSGSLYGMSDDGFIRLNIACTKKTLKTGILHLSDYLNTIRK